MSGFRPAVLLAVGLSLGVVAIASVVPAVAEKGRSHPVCRPRLIVIPQEATSKVQGRVIGQCKSQSTIVAKNVAKSEPQTCIGGIACHGSCSGGPPYTANWTCCKDSEGNRPRCVLDCQHEEMDCVYE
jgi:hypothetical protein